MLDEAEGRLVARYARLVICEMLGGAKAVRPQGGPYDQPAATFVTLHRHGELHGCVGALEPRRALADDVREHAIAAALDDPRATPLSLVQVDELEIEISLLSALERVPATDADDAAASLRPGVDGVVFAIGLRRSTYLPQVWQELPEPLDFLRRLRRKAGLAADFWSPEVAIYRYQVSRWRDGAVPIRLAAASP